MTTQNEKLNQKTEVATLAESAIAYFMQNPTTTEDDVYISLANLREILLGAGLLSIRGLTTATDKMIYTTALNTYAVTDLTAFGRSLVDDADASAARTTLGLGTIATQDADDITVDDLTVNGDADLSNATSIDFPTGTFPLALSASGVDPTGTITNNVCRYTRYGNRVEGDIYFTATSVTGGTGIFELTGLPFTVKNAVGSRAPVVVGNGLSTGINVSAISNAGGIGGYCLSNSTTIRFYALMSDGTSNFVNAATHVGSSIVIYAQFNYEIN